MLPDRYKSRLSHVHVVQPQGPAQSVLLNQAQVFFQMNFFSTLLTSLNYVIVVVIIQR